MINGIKFDAIKSNDNFIIDDHHRYICSLLANNFTDRINYSKTSATKSFN